MNHKNRDALADALYRASYGSNDSLRQTALAHFEQIAEKLIHEHGVLVPSAVVGRMDVAFIQEPPAPTPGDLIKRLEQLARGR